MKLISAEELFVPAGEVIKFDDLLPVRKGRIEWDDYRKAKIKETYLSSPSMETLCHKFNVKLPSLENREKSSPTYYDLLDRYAREVATDHPEWRKGYLKFPSERHSMEHFMKDAINEKLRRKGIAHDPKERLHKLVHRMDEIRRKPKTEDDPYKLMREEIRSIQV